jgi:hypothetical protein
MSTALAMVIVLVILIAVFIATRKDALPLPAAGPCSATRACPHPQVCVNGICVDAALSSLLGTAQTTANNLYITVQQYINKFTSRYAANARALSNYAVSAGFRPVPAGYLATLDSDLVAGLANMHRYMDMLSSPRCSPGVGALAGSTNCGYYAEIMAQSTSTPGGVLYKIAQSVPDASTASIATSAFPSVAADLKTINDAIANEVAASSGVLGRTLVLDDYNELMNAANDITQKARAMTDAANALNQHFV